MRGITLLMTVALLVGCQSNPTAGTDQLLARIESVVSIDWGIVSDNPGHLTYQHAGIPGNIAILNGTQDTSGEPLKVVVLGPPLAVRKNVPIKILGVLEQAGPNGLIRTFIGTVGSEQSLVDLETQRSGSLPVLEAGLVKLTPGASRSLGFQSAAYALDLIKQAR